MREIHAVAWQDGLVLLDQTQLPSREEYISINSVNQLIAAIEKLQVRGAPALGVAGAYGVALAIKESQQENWSAEKLSTQIERIRLARPTAVNLAWGVDQATAEIKNGFDAVLEKARSIHQADIQSNLAMAKNGADFIEKLFAQKISKLKSQGKALTLLTHCNTGSLAATGVGTALGVIRELANRGLVEEVLADETRPLLQGARLTAWELAASGIKYRIMPDSAAALAITSGLVDCALVGADRIAANGDSANKIGTLSVALACNFAGIPFFIVAPESTVDRFTKDGSLIPIEQRDPKEVREYAGLEVAPTGAAVFNPAFDVTPAKLITAVITDKKIYQVSQGEGM